MNASSSSKAPVNNILYMLKQQYISDVQGANPSQRLPADIPITYSDIVVWFTNKDCSEVLDFAKPIWDATPKQLGQQTPIDVFLTTYAEQVSKDHGKFDALMEKLKHIQHIHQRTKKSIAYLSDQTETIDSLELKDPVECVLGFKYIEESDALVQIPGAEYYLQVTHNERIEEVRGEFQLYSMKLLLSELRLDLTHEMGTLQLNLVAKLDGTVKVIASRNLDPFTSRLMDDVFQLKLTDSNDYVNLIMEVQLPELSSPSQMAQFMQKRLNYLDQQYNRNFKKCYLYKTKLRVLLKPFASIKLNDDGLYFVRVSNQKKIQSCNKCIIF